MKASDSQILTKCSNFCRIAYIAMLFTMSEKKLPTAN